MVALVTLDVVLECEMVSIRAWCVMVGCFAATKFNAVPIKNDHIRIFIRTKLLCNVFVELFVDNDLSTKKT